MISRALVRAALTAALLGSAGAQEVPPLKPFRTGEIPVRRAEPVRKSPTPIPVPPRATAVSPAPVAPAAPPKAVAAPAPPMDEVAGEIRIAPSNTARSPDQVQLSIADSFYAKGMFDLAAPEYEKYLGLYPGSPDKQTALFRLGESYRRNGTLNAARSSFQSLLDQFTAGDFVGPAAYRLAEIYFQEKNYHAAAPLYRKASVRLRDPKLALAARFFTARSLEALGQKTEARGIYEDLVSTPQNNPFLDNSRLSYALLLKDLGRTAEAQKQAAALAQSSENPELKVEGTVYSGLWLVELGQSAKGEVELKRALEMPNIGRWRDVAQFGLVQLAFNAEKYQQVVDTWTGRPKDFGAETRPQVMLLAAKSWRALKKSEEAAQLFRQVVQEFPNSNLAKEASYELLITLYRAGDQNLQAAIDQYLSTDPDDQKREQVLLMKAEILFKNQDFKNAADLYERLATSRQLTGLMKGEVLTKLGWCWLQTRENERAIKVYTELIDGFPTFKSIPAALLHRAVARLRTNNPEAAIKDLRQLIDKFPKAKERESGLLQLARLLGQRGDTAGMVEMFKVYLREQPNATGPEAAEANFWIGSVAFDNKAHKEAMAPLKKAAESKEYFEKASMRLMLCHYYLEDKDGCAREIDAYLAGGAKGQVPYDVLHGIGIGYHEDANKAAEEGLTDVAAQKHQAATKYLGMLTARSDAMPVDIRALGRSSLALGAHQEASAAFSSFLGLVKEAAPRAEGLNDLAQAQIGLSQFAEAQNSVNEGLKLQPIGEINAKLRVTAGDIQAAQARWPEAAKIYESVTVIIDEESITPGAGEKAVNAYRKAGLDEEANKLLNRLQSRYPEYFQNKKAKGALGAR